MNVSAASRLPTVAGNGSHDALDAELLITMSSASEKQSSASSLSLSSGRCLLFSSLSLL